MPESFRRQRCRWDLTCGRYSSDRYPVPLCDEHLVYAWSIVQADLEPPPLALTPPAPVRVRRVDGFVYYLRIADHIKIGFAGNLGNRLKQYPPSARLLAVQRGDQADERAIHLRFADHLEAGREWFRPAPDLLAHIEQVARDHPQSPGTDVWHYRASNPAPRPAMRPKTTSRHVL